MKQWASREEAIAAFKEREEPYKIEIIEQDIPDDGHAIGLYHHQEYTDMCRGPHVPNTRFLRHFKLTNVTGAYWRGNVDIKQLQRIYGIAFTSKQDLDAHLKFLEEAAKRDHRIWQRHWTSSTCRKRALAWCSGIQMAGLCIACLKIIFVIVLLHSDL